MSLLRIKHGSSTMFDYRLPLGRTVIGRADTCDIALPDEQISRTHCFFELGAGGRVSVTDRSRHGTFLEGQRVTHRELQPGDRVQIGCFVIEFVSTESQERCPTSPNVMDRSHEQLVGADAAGLGFIDIALRCVAGPAKGHDYPIPSSETTVGHTKSRIQVPDPSLLPNHFKLLVNRGRVMVESLSGAVVVDGQSIRGLLPLFAGEQFMAGATTFMVTTRQVEEQPESPSFGEMIGESVAMKRVFGVLRRMAGHMQTVLILGESGTGKELAARALHDQGPRASGPFVPVNCSAIAATLFESELFGHEKGAFTGATQRRDGAFQQAHGGTLFLDEIGEIPLAEQAKLLRALESGEVRRVGAQHPEFPDVRVVAATNRNLLAEVQNERFREDLYFRLAVLTVRLPALRERPSDVPLLARALANALGPDIVITPAAMTMLAKHPWPGNVRELRNVLVRAFVVHGPVIDLQGLSFTPNESNPPMLACDGVVSEQAERALFMNALSRNRGNRTALAKELGLPRTTLIYKLRRLGLD